MIPENLALFSEVVHSLAHRAGRVDDFFASAAVQLGRRSDVLASDED